MKLLDRLLNRTKTTVAAPPRQSLLTGSCNRCGSCCVIGSYRCLNLKGPRNLHSTVQSGPTTCAAYDRRYNGMPIVVMDDKGNVFGATCGKDSLDEDMAIVERGIGQGCSLEVVDASPS